MRREWSELAGVQLRPATIFADDRGNFTKLIDEPTAATQVCSSFNQARGTIRGLHVQVDPFPETKTLWCTTGGIWDVLVDVRPESATYGDWTAVELTANDPHVLTVPPGLAHGYQVLHDRSTVVYLISGQHAPAAARTLLWSDPNVGIAWPLEVTLLSDSDRHGTPWPLS